MLWVLALALSAFCFLCDQRTGKIPNAVTFPMLSAGLLLHFPGTEQVWLLTILLCMAFANHGMSAGDVKLWIGLAWLMPLDESDPVLWIAMLTFFITALIQIGIRLIRKEGLMGKAAPAAWRTIPFVLMLWHAH